MLRFAPLAALVAIPLALWSFAAPSAPPAPVPLPENCNLWMHEPLVSFDVTGSTLSGPVDESLQVFSDGTVKRFSQSSGLAQVVFISPQEASALSRDLFLAGAFTSCDQPSGVTDVPLNSLTLFRGTDSPLAHTVNWWSTADGPYATYENLVSAFKATHLP